MNDAIILHAGGKWNLFENRQVVPLLDYPKIESPVYVLNDFDNAISGVSVVNNKSSYAESLISRRLRDDGLIDGEVKILIHHGVQTDGGYQVLYTAVPMNLWQNMQSWAQAQTEHCLLIFKTALMHDLLSRENEGVIFRSGRKFSLLVRRQKAMDYFSVLALSDSEDDLLIAAKTLAERVKKRWPEEETGRLLKWRWYPLGAASSDEDEILAGTFKKTTDAHITVVNTEAYTQKSGEQIHASLAALRPYLSEKLAVNPLIGKISYFAEKNLMRIACCIGVITAGFFIWGLVSLLQAKAISMQAGQKASETQKIVQEITQKNPQEKITSARQRQLVYATRDFVGLASKAQNGIDPYSFLHNLRFAAGDNIKILRVQIQPENNDIIIEGWVEQTGGSDKPLADFVERLRELGFSPKAIDSISGANARRNSLFVYRLQSVSDDERTDV